MGRRGPKQISQNRDIHDISEWEYILFQTFSYGSVNWVGPFSCSSSGLAMRGATRRNVWKLLEFSFL